MYSLIEGLLAIPSSNYTNSMITYVAGAIVILFTVVVFDLVYRIIRSFFGRRGV